MSIRVGSLVGLVGSAVITALFATGGCAGSKAEGIENTGGTTGAESGGGPSASEGGSANGGSATTGAGGASATGGDSGAAGVSAYPCKKGVPTGPAIAPGTSGIWGSASPVTGGTFLYQASDAEKLAADTVTTTGSVTYTGSVTPNGYTGAGLYFKDPEKCWDLNAYPGGVRMTLSGSLGGGKLVFQVQTNNDYPIDTANKKGACEGTWSSGCGNNSSAAIEITSTPTVVDVPWSTITGGAPNALEIGEVLGVQWQINCPTDATANCDVTLTIGEVTLY